MRTHILFGIICLLLSVHRLSAQQYFFAHYTPRDGLVNNRASTIYQDSKGRLYIGTYGGLSVYDGARFTNYTTENGLATGLVNDVVEMGEDSLWIIPNGHSLHCLVHGILKNISTADNFYPVINQLIRTGNGEIYALADEGFFRLEHNRFVRIPLPDSTGKEIGINMTRGIEWQGRFFLACQVYRAFNQRRAPSLIIYDTASHSCLVPTDTPVCYCPVLSPTHDVLIATTEGVRMIDQAALQQHVLHFLPPPHPFQTAAGTSSNYLYFDNGGDLWIGAWNEVKKIDPKGGTLSFTPQNGLPRGEINAILQDHEQSMWFTSGENGIARLISQQVQYHAGPAPGFTVTDMYARSNSDSVWFYDDKKKCLLVQTGNTSKIYRGMGHHLPTVQHILIGPRSYMLGDREIYAVSLLPEGRYHVSLLHRDTIHISGNATLDSKGRLIIPSARTLTVLLNNGKVIQRPLPSMADQAAPDKYGHIWTITRGDGLQVYAIEDEGQQPVLKLLHTYTREMPIASPRAITIDKDGRVWIGTRDHGLFCIFFNGWKLLSWRQLTVEDGLSENFIEFLHCDDDNTIWACMPTGVARIRSTRTRFAVEDVIPSNDIYQRILKVLPSAKGVHWAMATEGFLKFMPSGSEKSDYIPSLLFSRILVADEPFTGADAHKGAASFPYDRNTLSFYMGVPSFVNERLTRYTYLLEGSRNAKWSAPSTQSVFQLVNLSPGKYTLRVKALFPSGHYPELSTSWPFVILPPWWQTWWFRVTLVLAAGGLILLLIRYYIRSKLEIERTRLEKKRAIEKERTRIATDMHDDLGAGLSRIKFLSETIYLKKEMGRPVQDDIRTIGRYAGEMIDKMGEIVWALNEKNDSLNDLLSYTRSYAAEYLMQSGLQCFVESPGEAPCCMLSGEFRRNVYLTIKEALHNIVKHAQARKVVLRMVIDGHLIITIEDDGVGLDPDRARPFGNGLHNMQQRIRDIGGHLLINGNAGTRIYLSVPLP